MKRPIILLTTGMCLALTGCDKDSDRGERSPDIRAAEPEEEVTRDQGTMPQEDTAREGTARQGTPSTDNMPVEREASEASDEAAEARQLVKDAAATLGQMKKDSRLKELISRAKGVFIVPKYGRGAAGIGASGGEGVLVTRQQNNWSDPAFYDLGGISVGAQFGAEGGEIAMLLMSDDAVNAFKQDSQFSLNADAKLTLVDYSALAEATTLGDDADVVFWSGTKGAFAGISLSATGISWDDEENPAYYGKPVTANDVLTGKITGPKGEVQQALSGL